MPAVKSSLPATGTSVLATLLVFVSSACCVGPLAVALSFVGLSSSTLLTVENTFGPFRPYILGLTVLVLAVGFWAAYRKEPCEDGQVCAVPATRRVQRAALWLAAVLLAALLYFTYVHPNLDVLFGIY